MNKVLLPRKYFNLFFSLLFTFAFLTLLAPEKANASYGYKIWGYGETTSEFQNKTLDLHISSETSTGTGFIYNIEDLSHYVEKIDMTGLSSYYCHGSEYGCNWPTKYSLNLDSNKYKSGIYIIYLFNNKVNNPPSDLTTNTNYTKIQFVVKDDNPGSTSNILVVFHSFTMRAQNPGEGPDGYGACFYGSPQCREQVPTVSFDRPMKHSMIGNGSDLPRWLKKYNYTAEYASSEDIEDLDFVKNYRLVIFDGHEEYWSAKMKRNMEDFRDLGGNILFLTSNTIYWQVSYNPSAHTMTSYKQNYTRDPYYNKNNNKVRTLYSTYEGHGDSDASLNGRDNNHDAKLLGIHSGQFYNEGDYKVYQTDNSKVNWVFDGLGLHDGDYIAKGHDVAGDDHTEVDNIDFTWVNGKPVRKDEADLTPLKNLTIIGQSTTGGGATLGIYSAKNNSEWGYESTVIATGSWNWVPNGLADDLPDTSRMTRNILNRMSSKPSLDDIPPKNIKKIVLQNGLDGYNDFKATYMSSWDPDVNYPTSDSLKTRLNAFSTLTYADLSSVPKDANILSASIIYTFKGDGIHDMQYNYMDLRPLKRNWGKEGSSAATWNHAIKSTTRWATSGARGSSDADYSSAPLDRAWGNENTKNKRLSFNLTDKFSDFLNNNFYGFLLDGYAYTTNYFYSEETSSVSQNYRPKIVVLYTDGTEVPPSNESSISVTPSNIEKTVDEGNTTTDNVTVKNTGDTTVNVKIHENLDWLSVNMSEIDSLPSGNSKNVQLTFNSPTQKDPGTYSGTVYFDTYYNGEKVDTDTVSVKLTVKGIDSCDDTVKTKTFSETADTYINSWEPNTNYSTESYTFVRADKAQKPLFYFDLSSIKNDSQIESAKLTFNVANDRDTDFTYNFYPVSKDWQNDQSNTNWSKAKGNLDWSTTGIGSNDKYSDKATISGVRSGKNTVDVTNIVQKWTDKTYANDGFVVEANAGANVYQSIYSNNHYETDKRPTLTVKYKECNNQPPAEESSISVTPTSIEKTVDEGNTATSNVTVKNTGDTTVNVKIHESLDWIETDKTEINDFEKGKSENVVLTFNSPSKKEPGTYTGTVYFDTYYNGEKVDTDKVNVKLSVNGEDSCDNTVKTKKLNVSADTYISEWDVDTNYSTSSYLFVRADNAKKPLFYFDTSSIKKGSEIQSATFEFNVDNDRDMDFTYNFYPVKKDWQNDQSHTNWKKAKNSLNWSSAGIGSNDKQSDKVSLSNVRSGKRSVDLKKFVQKWVDESYANDGFVIEGSAGANVYQSLTSSENYKTENRPTLTIKYKECSGDSNESSVSVSPTSIEKTVDKDNTSTGNVTVKNTGDTTVNVKIHENLDWIETDKTEINGFEKGKSENVVLTFNSPEKQAVGTYTGTVYFDTYYNGEKVDTDTVSVKLIVENPGQCEEKTYTKSIVASTDTYIHSWNPDNNYNTTKELDLRPGQGKPLLYWNLSSIPSNATIKSATFTFNVTYYRDVPFYYTFYKLKKAWQDGPSYTTWEKANQSVNWSSAGAGSNADKDTSETIKLSNVGDVGQYSVDFKPFVEDWIKGSSNNNGTIIETSAGANVDTHIASKEYSDSSKRPTLKVKYTVCE